MTQTAIAELRQTEAGGLNNAGDRRSQIWIVLGSDQPGPQFFEQHLDDIVFCQLNERIAALDAAIGSARRGCRARA